MNIIDLHRRVRDKGFSLAFPSVKISTKEGEAAFEGMGFLDQTDNGHFHLDLMVNTDSTDWVAEVNQFIPHDVERAFQFDAIDDKGRLWSQGEHFRPRLGDTFSAYTSARNGEPFHLRVNVRSILLKNPAEVSPLDESREGSELGRCEFVIPKKFRIPTPGRHIKSVDSNVEGKVTHISHDHYVVEYLANKFTIKDHPDEEFLVGSFVGPKDDFPPFPDQKIREVIMFLSASVFDFPVLLREGPNQNVVCLLGGAQASSSNLPPPVEKEDFWKAFKQSLVFLLESDSKTPSYHPVFSTALDLMLASFGTRANHDIALTISIESAVRHCKLSDHVDKDLVSSDTVGEIVKHLAKLDLCEGLHKRISDMLNGSLTRWSASDRLYKLESHGLITEEQIRAWKKLRHPSAHGSSATVDNQTYGKLYTLLNTIILATVGYKKSPIDYGTLWSSLP